MSKQNQHVVVSQWERIHVRSADYFIAMGGSEDSDVMTHEHECGCRECGLYERACDQAAGALNFEERELAV